MHAIVYLVGAGPGDPGLITLAGVEALRRADVVVYDYLANTQLLQHCRADAELVYVGKSGTSHTKTQNEINALLVQKTREGETRNTKREMRNSESGEWVVVRLKGGDPYVFGRGGEEGEYLRAHGIDFVEVPGITAGIAAPAYAGIPVTHRDFATTLTLVTGHEREDADPADQRINFAALAQLAASGTICFYMGIKSLRVLMQKLIAAGLDPAIPAAVIRWGTHPHQQTVTGTVSSIADEVAWAQLTAPAMTVVGQVVSLRASLNWFEQRPLFGRCVLVTRTRQQPSELAAGLAALGAKVIEAPTIELADPEDWTALDETLMHIPAHDWVVFTSANGVRAAWRRLRHLGFDARHFGASNIAAIGPATGEALEHIGITPDLLPEKFVGEELAAALKREVGEADIRGKSFLLLRADIARPVLREELLKLGARVEDVAIYQTVKPKSLPDETLAALREGSVDWVTFTSASTATNLHELLPAELRAAVAKAKKLSIGPVTTAALEKLGWPPAIEAARHDIPGMLAAISTASARP